MYIVCECPASTNERFCPFASILQRRVFPSGTFRVSKLQAVRVCVAIAWGAVEAISEATFEIIELTKRPRLAWFGTFRMSKFPWWHPCTIFKERATNLHVFPFG